MLNSRNLNRAIFILSLIGFFIAGYVLQGYLRHASVFCPAGGGCDIVRLSPYAWPFGIPVPAIGFVGYTILASLSFLRTVYPNQEKKLLLGLLGMSAFGVAFVSWFTLTEAFLIKGFCSWCLISAVDMYVLFGLILTSRKLAQNKKIL